MGCCAGGSGQPQVERPGGVGKKPTKNPNLPTLGYWNIRGMAQSIRYQLIYQGIEYNEEIYEPAKGEDVRANWMNVKHNLGIEFPNLPYFIDGKLKMSETLAIH